MTYKKLKFEPSKISGENLVSKPKDEVEAKQEGSTRSQVSKFEKPFFLHH
jgi:hypothetical protein